MKTGSKLRLKAFTLIELLAAMAITAVLVLVIVALTSRGVELWRWVLQDVRTTNLARTAIDTMTKDFESMQFRPGNAFEWVVVQWDSDLVSKARKRATSRNRGRRNVVSNIMTMGPEGAKITNASQLLFFTTATDRHPAKFSMDMNDDREVGDIAFVGYKLLYKDQILNQAATQDSPGFPVYSLYRNLVSPADTLEHLIGSTDLDAAYEQFAKDETAPANFLVENIVEMTLIFEIDYQKKTGSSSDNKSADHATQRETALVPIMVTGGNRLGSCSQMEVFGNRLNLVGVSNGGDLSAGRIISVTISLTVVTDEGMTLVDQVRQNERVAPKQEEFFERYTKSFTQRVVLSVNR